MNDKRFIVLHNNVVWDNQLGEVVCRCILESIGDAENVCQRLNGQQSSINNQEQKIKILQQEINDTQAILEMLTEKLKRVEMMNEKRFSFGAVSPNVATIKENGDPLDIGEIVDILNNQDEKIRQLEDEKIGLMEDNACQYRKSRSWNRKMKN